MLINSNDYIEVLNDIKAQIKTAQRRLAFTVNGELFMLYCNIGKVINEYSA